MSILESSTNKTIKRDTSHVIWRFFFQNQRPFFMEVIGMVHEGYFWSWELWKKGRVRLSKKPLLFGVLFAAAEAALRPFSRPPKRRAARNCKKNDWSPGRKKLFLSCLAGSTLMVIYLTNSACVNFVFQMVIFCRMDNSRQLFWKLRACLIVFACYFEEIFLSSVFATLISLITV